MVNEIIKEDLEYIADYPLDWDRFRNKTVLITGANGMLPSYMAYVILLLNDKREMNCRIIALVRNVEKAHATFRDYLGRKDFIIKVQDVCCDIEVDEKIDFVIHAASHASPIHFKTDPVGTINANVIGTNNLLRLSLKHHVESFLFFSSGEVYGETAHIPTSENDYGYLDPTKVRSCYGESKRLGETMCVAWFAQFNVPCKIVRPFHTYGPGLDLKDGRVFADFVDNIVNNQDIVMKSDGSDIRAFCYIADAVTGFFTVLFHGENGEAYNIGNPSGEISILALSKLLVDLFPEKGLKVIVDAQRQDGNYMKSSIRINSPEISKARHLGWNPKYSVSEGFLRTVQSFDPIQLLYPE